VEQKRLERKACFEKQGWALREENFAQLIEHLPSLEFSLQKSFASQTAAGGRTKTGRRGKFRAYICDEVAKSVSSEFKSDDNDLREMLFNLICFAEVWNEGVLRSHSLRQDEKAEGIAASAASESDSPLLEEVERTSEEIKRTDNELNKLRQTIKYKKDIPKPTRRAVRVAILAQLFRLTYEIEQNLKGQKENRKKLAELRAALVACNSNEKVSVQQMIDGASNCIDLLETVSPVSVNSPPDSIKKKYEKAARAVAGFKTWTDRILQLAGIVLIAIPAALSCALITGGSIFLLLSGFGAPIGVVIFISVLVAVSSFSANARFMSINIPGFLLRIARGGGGITEYIDAQGNRTQVTRLTKSFLVLAVPVSVAVGISTAVFTAMSGAKILAFLFPALATLFPAGPAIILGILCVAIAIAMSLVMFRAFVEAAPSLSFFKIVQAIRRFFNTLTPGKFMVCIVKGAIIGFVVFGLYTLVFAGIPLLAETFTGAVFGGVAVVGNVVGAIVGWFSFIGQIPFTVRTVSNWCDFMGDGLRTAFNGICVFFRIRQPRATACASSSSTSTSILVRIFENLYLSLNALGNGVLVVQKTLLSVLAGVACFVMSFSANLVRPDRSEQLQRAEMDRKAVQHLQGLEAAGRVCTEGRQIPSSHSFCAHTGLSRTVSSPRLLTQPSTSSSGAALFSHSASSFFPSGELLPDRMNAGGVVRFSSRECLSLLPQTTGANLTSPALVAVANC